MDTGQLGQSEDRPLNQEILSILGDEVDDNEFGPPIHQEVANRWINIAKTGLDRRKRTDLINKYPITANCSAFKPPKLNHTAPHLIKKTTIQKDNRLCIAQAKIGACLMAIEKVITQMLAEESGGNQQYIKQLNDVGRILALILHDQSMIRRKLILMKLKPEWKVIVSNSPIDEWLFGENFEERVKAATFSQLRQNSPNYFPPNFVNNPQSNFEGPNTSQHQMGPFQHQMTPPQHQMGPPQHQMIPPQHQIGPPQQQMTPPQQQMTPPQHQMGPPQHQMGPPQHQMVPPQHQVQIQPNGDYQPAFNKQYGRGGKRTWSKKFAENPYKGKFPRY